MAFVHTFLFLYAAICFAAEGSEFVKVKCKEENVGLFGQPSMLECNLELSPEVSQVTNQVIDWKRKGEKPPVFLYNKGIIKRIPGYDLAENTLINKTLNVSLLITNTTVADDGEFRYSVHTDSGVSKGSTRLKVKAKYSPPKVHSIPEKIIVDEDSTLICESGGGYPEGKLRWFDMDGTEWTASSEMEVTQAENGLFQLTSKLSLLRGSTFSKYTCVVFNASGVKEAEIAFEPATSERIEGDNKGNSAAKVVAPVVVIGSLIVGLLLVLVLVLRRRRARLARRQSTAPLMNNHREVPRGEFDVEEGDPQKMDE